MKLFGLIALLTLAMVSLLPPASLRAQGSEGDRVTVVILDQSGSMQREDLPGEKPRDKEGLRCSAVRLLADLATDHDYLALVKLESHDDETGPNADRTAEVLMAPTQMGYEARRAEYKAKVDCSQAHNNTPIADSLQKAYDLLVSIETQRAGAPFTGQVLLLTDGEPQPAGDIQRRDIEKLLPQFDAKGWSINTIGLKLREYKLKAAIDLLNLLANRTGGRYYGDVARPLELQRILVEFFAQQTGRTLSQSEDFTLRAGGEKILPIADHAQQIDILVAKENPSVHIRLVRPDGSEVTGSDAGVALLSNTDPYYAAFSIQQPAGGRWSLRADSATSGIVNLLVTTNIQLKIKDTGILRASNEPVVIEALFYERNAAEGLRPITIANVAMNAELTFGEEHLPVPLHDDGQLPDRSAGDGIYAGAVSVTTPAADLTPTSAAVRVEAAVDGQRYSDSATLQLAAVPNLAIDDPDGIFRLPPGSAIQLPLRLELNGDPIPTAGWTIAVRQRLTNEIAEAPIEQSGDRFLAGLQPQSEGQDRYTLEADLVGIDQFRGLRRMGITLQAQVIFQPTLMLHYEGADRVPVGYPVQMSGAMLKQHDLPMQLDAPPKLMVRRDNAPSEVVNDVQLLNSGVYSYTFTPNQPGRYLLTLSVPDQHTDPVEQILIVEPVPVVIWTTPQRSAERSEQTVETWRWLDWLRGLPVLGWPVDRIAPGTHSGRFRLEGTVRRGEQPYDAPFVLRIRSGTQERTMLERELGGDRFSEEFDLPDGAYQAELVFADLFKPGIACCQSVTTLELRHIPQALDLPIALGIFIGEVLLFGLAILLVRYKWWARRPQRGDRLVFAFNTGKIEKIDLYTSWRLNLLHPSTRDFTPEFRKRGGKEKGWPERGLVEYRSGGVQLNKTTLSAHPKPVGGAQVSFEAKPSRGSSPRPAARPPSRGHRRGGRFALLAGLFGGPRRRPRPSNRRSTDKRRR